MYVETTEYSVTAGVLARHIDELHRLFEDALESSKIQ